MTKWTVPGAVLAAAMLLSGCGGYCDSAPEVLAVRQTAPAATEPETGGPMIDISAKQPTPEDLLHRRFALISVDGKDVAVDEPSQRPDIEFNEGFQIAGHVCNRFRGPAELRDGKLYAERLATTMMLCIKPELNELERLFHAMLRAGADITLAGDRLTLSQGGRTLVYEQADWVR